MTPLVAERRRLQWLNLPESWGVFLLIAIVGLIVFAVFWLYRREGTNLPPTRQNRVGLPAADRFANARCDASPPRHVLSAGE